MTAALYYAAYACPMSDGVDYSKVLFGQHAVHVPAWLWVQHQGTEDGATFVSFVGASKVQGLNPLRFGSDRTHQLLVGEIVVRPHRVAHTDAYRGHGLAGLFSEGPFPLADLMGRGDGLLDLR